MASIPSPIRGWVREFITGEGSDEVSSQAPVQSVNSQTGNVTVTAPVDSVNGETGTVSLSASDVGALGSSSDVDHQQTTNRTHDGDDITPSSVTTQALEANTTTTGTEYPTTQQSKKDDQSDTTVWHDLFAISSPSAGRVMVALTDSTGGSYNSLWEGYWSSSFDDGAQATTVVEEVIAGTGISVRWDGDTLQWQPDDEFANQITVHTEEMRSKVDWLI